MKPFPDKYELIFLFESEPLLTDNEIDWYYNQLHFVLSRGDDRIECDIEPACGSLVFKWWIDNAEKANLVVSGIKGLEVITQGRTEMLVASFGESSATQILKLRLKPSISISWKVCVP